MPARTLMLSSSCSTSFVIYHFDISVLLLAMFYIVPSYGIVNNCYQLSRVCTQLHIVQTIEYIYRFSEVSLTPINIGKLKILCLYNSIFIGVKKALLDILYCLCNTLPMKIEE